ncbi:hypothetical protein [Streptomyces sp. NPDC047928]|uniref:hypothetical protein n=1 Tax=unclassified Streptomyces TaxID=2593676 RepID=UPI0037154B3C
MGHDSRVTTVGADDGYAVMRHEVVGARSFVSVTSTLKWLPPAVVVQRGETGDRAGLTVVVGQKRYVCRQRVVRVRVADGEVVDGGRLGGPALGAAIWRPDGAGGLIRVPTAAVAVVIEDGEARRTESAVARSPAPIVRAMTVEALRL